MIKRRVNEVYRGHENTAATVPDHGTWGWGIMGVPLSGKNKRLEERDAYWTCDEVEGVGPLYYFAPRNAAPPPYRKQVHVEAILDIADDGTLAGVELVHGPIKDGVMQDLPPPPRRPNTAKE